MSKLTNVKIKKSKFPIKLTRNALKTLQVNTGKLCNQACQHCHVNAGPKRTEIMELQVFKKIISLLEKNNSVDTVDITGGAPELNPNFRFFINQIKLLGKNIIDRCNLTVLLEPGQENTANFLADKGVQIISSLPCYEKDNVNAQRGKGVFEKSIKVLKKLNLLGYGREKSGLTLNLVYNPTGYYLPPSQNQLEKDYKYFLKKNYDIVFNNLYTITNMPISRYARALKRDGKMQEYMQLLIDNFNPVAANNVMCKELISVSWDGKIYDCDFNQMLSIPINWKSTNIMDLKSLDSIEKKIAVDDHCFGCTAGSGSSCSGTLTS